MRMVPPEPAQAYSPGRKLAAATGAAQANDPISSQGNSRSARVVFVISLTP